MTKTFSKKHLYACVLFAFAVFVGEVRAKAFTYQGQLKAQGQLVSDVCDLRFTLWDGPDPGAIQIGGTLAFDNDAVGPGSVSIDDGLFSVSLDFGNNIFDGSAVWLSVGVRCPEDSLVPYQDMDPRQPVSSTPNAQHADHTPWNGLTDVPAGFADGIDDAGELNLPFSQNYAGAETDAFTVIQTGTGRAGRFSIDNSDSTWASLAASSNGTAPTFLCTKTNTGFAARFQIINPNNTSPAVFASTNGTGVALSGDGGLHGYGVAGIANGPGNGVHATQLGSGNAVEATNTGTGRGVYAIASQEAVYGLAYGGGNSSGVIGESEGSTGNGVYGHATSTTGNNHGVMGKSHSDSGRGVYGIAVSSTGTTTGVYGQSDSTVGRGVVGLATSDTGTGIGVLGHSDGVLGTGVRGTGVKGVVGQGTGVNGIGGLFSHTGGGLALRAIGDVEILGWAQVNALQIMGGADLAERFVFSEDAQPGMVVAIDTDQPGKLCVSKSAYNTRVAGVISGANQLAAGIVLGETPLRGEVEYAVALTGRVWVNCDATSLGVNAGDFLTTARRAGFAMPVDDHSKARGAIIGKAMTTLAPGETGQVLVLVNLQ